MGVRNIGEKLGLIAAISTVMLAGCRTAGVIDSDFGEYSTAHDSRSHDFLERAVRRGSVSRSHPDARLQRA